MSSLALYAIAGIAVIAIAAIFGFILFASGMSFTSQLWWMGVCGLIFALIFYMVYASSHNRTVAFPLAGAFFVIGIASFYGSVFVNGNETSGGKLLWGLVISVFAILVLVTIFYMSREGESDKIRKSQRKVTP